MSLDFYFYFWAFVLFFVTVAIIVAIIKLGACFIAAKARALSEGHHGLALFATILVYLFICDKVVE